MQDAGCNGFPEGSSASGESVWQPDSTPPHFAHGPREECGVFGIYGPSEDVARITYFGLFALQHRGQESAGIATANGRRIALYKAMGLVNQVFDEDILRDLGPAHIAIGHNRYSTTGSSTVVNAQPICWPSAAGDIAVAHNGNLVNAHILRNKLIRAGENLKSSNDSEVIAVMLARAMHGSLEEALGEVLPQLQGAYSLVILTPTQMAAVRDPYGVRPLCIGKLDSGAYIVSSESCAINVVGGTYMQDVEPGQTVIFDENGFREEQIEPIVRHALCIFEFIYFARPDSHLFARTVYEARRRMGQELAREAPAPGAHVVIPIPDSAVPAALGYAEASRIPFNEGLVKNRYIQRTFINPDKRMRHLGARMKYSPLSEVIAGRSVVMVDDSIVRGTTTDKLVRMLRDAGASEVHVRITSPPVRYPCFYGIDMADRRELVAANKSVPEIQELIGATSLAYLSLPGVVRAIRKPCSLFCAACFNGHYPIPVPQSIRLSKMMLEKPGQPSVAKENGEPQK